MPNRCTKMDSMDRYYPKLKLRCQLGEGHSGLCMDQMMAHNCPEEHSDHCRELQCSRRGVKFYGD